MDESHGPVFIPAGLQGGMKLHAITFLVWKTYTTDEIAGRG